MSQPTTSAGVTPLNASSTQRECVPCAQANAVVTGTTNSIDTRDSEENTPLIIAAAKNDETGVTTLLAKGADPNAQNINGNTPLLIALSSGFVKVASILLQHDANVNISNLEGATALHYASILGDETIVKEVIKCGAYLNAQDLSQDTVLHWVVREQREHMLAFLLKHGCKPNLSNEDGESPLHLAAVCGEFGIVELLIKHGATSSRDSSGLTPLDEALDNGHYRIAQLLSQRSSSNWNQSPSPSSLTSSQRTCGEMYDRRMFKSSKKESFTNSLLSHAGASF
eukprot:TRINITY_DN598_c0_g1_i1.p1 TRINITY_DN598_c0_g1~~TRINITY_DN598_c0_g1_i1.p1  ORF type:complete len:283 (+),score=86.37 TRINITY_DN598_c0_g1_i1:158-1006(+)